MEHDLIWGFSVPSQWRSSEDAIYLNLLPDNLPTVEWVWDEMDRVWNEFKLDNSIPINSQLLGEFYRHPVWIMNGIFTATDPVSIQHRKAISKYLVKVGVKSIADYGGGFGELALTISKNIPDASISIIEPYPSQIGIVRIKHKEKITINSALNINFYDAIVAQDVLEHVEDPVDLARQIAESVCDGGYIIFANCFYPVIQCHLPATFHLRHTFPLVMKALGLNYKGTVVGAPHAQVYERIGPLDIRKARRAERLSQYFGPIFNNMRPILSKVKRMLVRK